jgi:carbonic anhydrase/acetyltransferase-like protein (isoleucine patch superfamily)
VVLHGCVIEDHCLIGMGAVILDGARIGFGSVVAGGSVVPPGKTYPPFSMIMGSPAKVARELRTDERELYNNHYKTYIQTKNEYLDPAIIKRL